MRRPLRFAALVAASLATAVPNAGAEDAAERKARALGLFENSETAYDSGRFADAIALLRQSYELIKEPVLLYNLGRAYEGLGDRAAAAQAYEEFLVAEPNAQDRGALERRIDTLRRQLAEQEALKKRALEHERARAQFQRTSSAVPWIVAGLGVAGLVSGGVVGILAGQRNDDAKSEPTYVEAERLQGQAETFATVANVCFIVSSIALAGGVLWGILDVTAARSPRRANGNASSVLTF